MYRVKYFNILINDYATRRFDTADEAINFALENKKAFYIGREAE